MGIISGTFESGKIGYYGVILDWTAETVVASNLSRVTANVSISYWNINIASRTCSCTVNGVTQTKTIGAINDPANKNTRRLVATFYFDVPHEADGSKLQCDMAASFSFNLSSSSYGHIGTLTASGVAALETIPRASAITYAAPGVLGGWCDVRWVPASADFRYKLEFRLGDWTGWTDIIHPNRNWEYIHTGYHFPMDVAHQITGAQGSNMTVTLHTYSDSGAANEIGSNATSFWVTVPETDATKPSVEIAVTPNGSPIEGLYIQGKSGVSVSCTRKEAKLGAGITGEAITVNGAAYSGGVIAVSGNVTVRYTVTDSRGFTGSAEQGIYVHHYSRPRVTGVVCERCNENDQPDDGGSYLHIRATREYAWMDGNNRCDLRYRINGGDEQWLISGEDLSADTVDSYRVAELSPAASYVVEIYTVDKLETGTPITVLVPTQEVEFHLREGGKGAAFGGYAQEEDLLEVWWRTRLRGQLDMAQNPIVNLPIPTEAAQAVPKGYVDGGCYVAAGHVMNSTNGDVAGYGTVTVIITGSLATVHFALKVETVPPESVRNWDYGINRDLLRGLNGAIPQITPINGGVCRFIKEGVEAADLTDYGGTMQTRNQFWVPARACLTDEADIGQWESCLLGGCSLTGVCFGTVNRNEGG